MGIVLFILAVIVLISLQCHADEDRLNRDYEDWKNRRPK
jgi:hypothetical protein